MLEIGDLTTLADYFVIATGSSNTQINALVDNVEKVLREEAQEEPLHREGYRAGTWVLLDYGDFIIHIMHQDAREYYRLERLWRDCPVVELPLEHPETTGDESADNGSDGDDAGEADE